MSELISEEELQDWLDSIAADEIIAPQYGALPEHWNQELKRCIAEIHRLRAENEQLICQKDSVYRERDCLVGLLTKIFPSYLTTHPKEDKNWDADWRTIVFIELPTGQASWHIHDTEVSLFDTHLRWRVETGWDGHSTQEKYERVNQIDAYRIKNLVALGKAVEAMLYGENKQLLEALQAAKEQQTFVREDNIDDKEIV